MDTTVTSEGLEDEPTLRDFLVGIVNAAGDFSDENYLVLGATAERHENGTVVLHVGILPTPDELKDAMRTDLVRPSIRTGFYL